MPTLVRGDREVDRVVIVTDWSMAAQGAIEVLNGELGPEAISVVTSPDSLLNGGWQSDLAILNPFDRKQDDVLANLPTLCRSNAVLALCPTRPREDILSLARIGVRGYVSWAWPIDIFIRAAHIVATGGSQIHTACVYGQNWEPESEDCKLLTLREEEILRAIASGMTHKEIARSLELAKTTVDTYVQRIRRKLCVGNKAELAIAAHRFGLVR